MRPPVNHVLSPAVYEVTATLDRLRDGAPDRGAIVRTLMAVKLVLEVLERDWDTAVSDRLAEIDTLRELLTKVCDVAPDPLRSSLLATLSDTTPSDLRVSTLDTVRDRLLAAMVDAESYLESCADATDEVGNLRTELRDFEHAFVRRYAVCVSAFAAIGGLEGDLEAVPAAFRFTGSPTVAD